MRGINILGSFVPDADEYTVLQKNYGAWRETNSNADVPFFSLFRGFLDNNFLSKLDPGPLALYLYFGFQSKNDTGESHHSVETIAKYFNKDTRTVDGWIKKLVKANLIVRGRDERRVASTFLLPTSNNIVHHGAKRRGTPQEAFDILVQLITRTDLKKIYGEIITAYHLFRWNAAKGTGKPSTKIDPVNIIFVITQRGNILTGHILDLKNLCEDEGIDTVHIDEVAIFDSPLQLSGSSIRGVAVQHRTTIKGSGSFKVLLAFMRDHLQSTEESWGQHPRVRYGNKDEFDLIDETEVEGATEQSNDDEVDKD